MILMLKPNKMKIYIMEEKMEEVMHKRMMDLKLILRM